MRKQILDCSLHHNTATQMWLNLESVAQVQVSSEQATNPIELALIPAAENKEDTTTRAPGWQAAQAGEQTIRLLFDKPENIRLIHLLFEETKQPRTQEFVLRYSSDQGASYQQILRQQYTFSPPFTCLQIENYRVQLPAVTSLGLSIMPDINGGSALASLAALKVA